MNESDGNRDMGMTVIRFIEEGAFWLAVALAYLKTAELMSLFAPKQILGYEKIETWYGLLCALLVEGLFVVMKYRLQFSASPAARLWATVLVIGTATVSFFAQGLDTAYITGQVAGMPEELRVALAVLVPAIPVIVMVALAIAGAAERSTGGNGNGAGNGGNSHSKGRKKASPTRWEDLTLEQVIELGSKSTAQAKAMYPGISEKSAYNWVRWARNPKRVADKKKTAEE